MTEAEQSLFEEQGFLVRREVFTGKVLDGLQQDALHLAEGYPDDHGRLVLLDADQEGQSKYNLVNCLSEPEVLDLSEALSGSRFRMAFPYWMNINTPSMYWHRDLDFIKNETVSDEFNIDAWCQRQPFSQIQWNLPLLDDSLLWIVPGSHRRTPTAEEMDILKEEKYSEDMPGKSNVNLCAGDALVYNVNIFHGVHNPHGVDRRTLHWCWVNQDAYNPYGDQCTTPLSAEERRLIDPRLVAMAEVMEL